MEPLLASYMAATRLSKGRRAERDIDPLHALFNRSHGRTSAPDSQRYFDYHHAPNDIFENVNKRELELGAINMAALIYLVDKYGL